MKWILAAAMAVFLCLPAKAQQSSIGILCSPVGVGSGQLEKQMGMVPVERGIAGEGYLAVLMENGDGDWALIIVDPEADMECMVASGSDWGEAPPLKKNSF